MSQTSSFVKKLASNDKPTRDSALESLQNFLGSKKDLSLLDLKKIWKGLYFSMWYCDRSKAQERLAENLGKLYSETVSVSLFPQFVLAFFDIISIEWPNIDQWRVDKYYLLIRRILRHNFKFLKQNNWDDKLVENWVNVLHQSVLSGEKNVSMGLPYHLCDIFIDELELVMFEDIQEEIDDLDNDASLEDKTKLLGKKIDIVSEVPVLKLLEPFQKLNKSAQLKTLREKCAEEVLNDERLKDWGVIEEDDDSDSSDNEDSGDDNDEDEWKGF
ncbi:ribosomal RNA-processing protein, putative [Candida dubliniensis CD36]|uniref:Ribosomal RNA-processing protein, putative n=1 Tax=Candida dubliniensis (strain CD36 / ATCC MYA-646 / CBS 7987 / NCPF 3949 / NRRL Y-17841) TaxID=573826 RepID=B9WEQ6_CANDC|nr:ribosomal RNA-processing protein, putative [Candida dubliniensis CD36]CAX43168.1 ribosomal RNA-processing protein, putative [Candida dubliniensis CD36]